MDGCSELERFLQEQVAQGVVDSSGSFSLSRAKALEKLAAFQLPRQTMWILKLVQAAVTSGAESLTIQQTSTDTELYFSPGDA